MTTSIRSETPDVEVVTTDVAPPLHINATRWADITVAALRIVAGLMFMQHGVQKHFGLLTPPDQPFTGAPEIFSQMWVAGTLEIAGGLLVAIGLFTRPVAFLLSGMMAVAYFTVHAPQGFWPILNGGELAALYCFVFLALSAIGAGPYSVDGLRQRRMSGHEERSVSRTVEESTTPVNAA